MPTCGRHPTFLANGCHAQDLRAGQHPGLLCSADPAWLGVPCRRNNLPQPHSRARSRPGFHAGSCPVGAGTGRGGVPARGTCYRSAHGRPMVLAAPARRQADGGPRTVLGPRTIPDPSHPIDILPGTHGGEDVSTSTSSAMVGESSPAELEQGSCVSAACARASAQLCVAPRPGPLHQPPPTWHEKPNRTSLHRTEAGSARGRRSAGVHDVRYRRPHGRFGAVGRLVPRGAAG